MRTFPNLRKMTSEERIQSVFSELSETKNPDLKSLLIKSHPELSLSESLIENSIGFFSLPIGVVDHFVMNRKFYPIPMVIEETSVIASCSSAAKWISSVDGHAECVTLGKEILSQIHIPCPKDSKKTLNLIIENKIEILKLANQSVKGLLKRGGGFKDLRVRELKHAEVPQNMLSVDFICDPCDAMGANLVTQACENLKPYLSELTGDRIGMAIVSNLNDNRLFKATIHLPHISNDTGERIQEASFFAEADVYRAATHNKGIFNAIDAILIATGNDWRAVEAGGHAYASQFGTYQPLSKWRFDSKSGLRGQLEMPLACGTVGGVTRLHPIAQANLSLLKVESSEELAQVCVTAGLIQNLAALRSLTGSGLTAGHMSLHASNLMKAAGATDLELQTAIDLMRGKIQRGEAVTQSTAIQLLQQMRQK